MRRITVVSVLTILAVTGLGGSWWSAQAATSPPIKIGLWQATETTLVSGLSLPPEAAAALKRMGRSLPGQTPHRAVYQSCLSAAEWPKELEERVASRNPDCSTSNQKHTSDGLSFDLTCTSRGYTTAGHWEIHFTSPEQMSGAGRMTSSAASPGAEPVSTSTTFDSRFLGSSCGDLAPGSSGVLEHN